MPKLYEAPALKRYGTVGDLTASDYKCTPGGDGGFAIWDHNLTDGPDRGKPTEDSWTNRETGETTAIGITPTSHTGSSCISGFSIK